ncbi:MAG: nicotinate-nucleotide--dimethylbenzimidazole phosphoribosyltransferase [Gammaproteobacteria bacterium]|jgi:nicotinate-nucleotide--dimethylbenzimidazole phosphoribosyltransferase|nr:nicotinate-nucleotide--dimethylbenzimidazole phosphoribosyltransferase [Gammaproteobacteria bacterium]MBT4491771.1 nicotinate-nucleotide--dimethylbenzimidazole phosphoribosyltransferase [Gammaproteobacteria bacterium]MBT7370282.1 nicotinate-nucleotide--dimethylbenzimidazole phosphoribosyltransferase [Gammaproteobacteria bacterium]
MSSFPLPDLAPVSGLLDQDLQRHIDSKTKPLGALGRVEDIGAQLGRIQRTLNPRVEHCSLLLFAGDHGVTQAGVSAFPAEVTRQMVLNFLAEGAAACVFAKTNDVELVVIDTGVAGAPIEDGRLVSLRIAAGTSNFIIEPAMTQDQMVQAVNNGVTLGQQTQGDAIAFGEMGIGNTSSAAMIVHKLIGRPLKDLVGRGTGLDDAGLDRKLRSLIQASGRTAHDLSAEQVLREYGGFEIATMVGAMLGAAATDRILIVDGYIATAAALLAVRLAPEIRGYMIFSHRSAEHGHTEMLKALAADGVLDLDLRLGEGTGALLVWPIIQCAGAMMSSMASFDSADVDSGPLE